MNTLNDFIYSWKPAVIRHNIKEDGGTPDVFNVKGEISFTDSDKATKLLKSSPEIIWKKTSRDFSDEEKAYIVKVEAISEYAKLTTKAGYNILMKNYMDSCIPYTLDNLALCMDTFYIPTSILDISKKVTETNVIKELSDPIEYKTVFICDKSKLLFNYYCK